LRQMLHALGVSAGQSGAADSPGILLWFKYQMLLFLSDKFMPDVLGPAEALHIDSRKVVMQSPPINKKEITS
jgi:hypothetical protein